MADVTEVVIEKCAVCEGEVKGIRKSDDLIVGVKNPEAKKGVRINGKWYHYQPCKNYLK